MEFSRPKEWVAVPFSRGSSQPGIQPRSPTLQVGSLPAEPPGKPKNTGVGSLSLLQGNLPDPGFEPGSPILQMDSLPTELLGIWASFLPQTVKDPPCRCRRHRLDPRVGKIPWRRQWQPTPVFLPEESHGQRSLAGYSPWGHKESDTTGRLTL